MGTIKLLLGLFVIVALVVLGANVIPPYFSNYQFQDAIQTEARLATYSTRTEENIRDTVFKKAQDLEIPITRNEILVHRTGIQGNGMIIIETKYTVHVDVPGYPMDLHFNPSTENKGVF